MSRDDSHPSTPSSRAVLVTALVMIAVFLLLWAALHFAGLVWLDYGKLQEALLELPVLAALRKEVFDFLFRTAWPALLALVIALLLRKALWDAGRLTAAAWLPEAPDFLKAPAIRSGWLDFRSPNTPRLIGQRWEDLGAATAELRAVAGRFPDDREIQLTLAQGAVNAVNGYGRGQRWDELAAAYGELRAVAQHFTDDREIQLTLAQGALAAARGAQGHLQDLVDQACRDLQRALNQLGDDEEAAKLREITGQLCGNQA